LREGGQVLALETDKAFAQISEDSDWAFYIQGDEVVHEKYLDTIYQGMLQCKEDLNIDGLLFKYLHFYGSFDYVGASSKWYKHEIRVDITGISFNIFFFDSVPHVYQSVFHLFFLCQDTCGISISFR